MQPKAGVRPEDSTRRARSARAGSVGSPRGTAPAGPVPAGRISSAAVRRDRLRVGLEGPEGKVARRLGAERYSPSRHDLAASPGPRETTAAAPSRPGPLRPPPSGVGCPAGALRSGRGPRLRRDCRPGRTVLSAHPTASRRRAGTGPRYTGARGLRRCRQPTRPVLKHGPRSLTRASQRALSKPRGAMKVRAGARAGRGGIPLAPSPLGAGGGPGRGAPPARLARSVGEVERERVR
ncbi:hypothetical protein ANANG_G00315680 [Anguilla anguilla]|uniref:Uncharacterized protein n=1 Tax=Anguilla anguilla TaxID=7936 RepID=A0A9D3RH52_ANGAN|nr:hypothetical protein ANANG_G00315680 [Anguilla anguilla]